MEPTVNILSEFLSTMTSVATWTLTQIGSVGTAILADPVLTFGVAITGISFAIGGFLRLLNRV